MSPVIIYGIGDFAKQIYFYLNEDSKRNVVAFCVDECFYESSTFLSLPVIKFREIERFYPVSEYDMIIAIGYRNIRNREIMFKKAKAKGYKLINYIHPTVIKNSSLDIGENNIILSSVIIEPYVQIKDNNVIWSGSLICHNVKIGSHNFIAAKSLIGGFSSIADKCFMGFNSVIKEKIVVDDETLIAAKSLVLNNTVSYSKYKGIPAKKYNSHESTGIQIDS